MFFSFTRDRKGNKLYFKEGVWEKVTTLNTFITTPSAKNDRELEGKSNNFQNL